MKISRLFSGAFIAWSVFALQAPATLRAEQSPRSPAPATSRIDPRALEALKRMSATLSAARAFTFRTRSIVEVPAKTGQFITLFSTAEVALKRPDKLRARLTGEAPHFDFYFDGATASAFAPAGNVYSTVEAPSTIDTMLPAMQQETGIRFATAPLLFSDPYSILTRGLLSGALVGPAVVNGRPCEHLAFRSPGVNWEIWVGAGQRAFPWRLAVTFTDRTNFPRVLVEFLNWNLNPWLKTGDFSFRKPADAREIPFVSVFKRSAR